MANDPDESGVSLRRLLQGVSLLLLLALLAQLGWLYHGKKTRQEIARNDGRDVQISVATGAVTGKQHEQPAPIAAVAPPPAAPAVKPAPGTPIIPPPLPPASPSPSPAPDPAFTKSASGIVVRSALNPAPNPALTELSHNLALPKIGPDGLTPAHYYAKPAADPGMPRIALVIEQVGLHEANTQTAEALDESVTLAFSPYTPHLNQRIAEARGRGHEVWLEVPMQPDNYPADDAGPYALLAGEPADKSLERLHQLMGTAGGYVGLVSPAADLAASGTLMGPLAEELRARGLMLLTHGDVLQLPQYDAMRATIQRSLPATATRDQCRQMLSELEAIARNTGSAAGSLPDLPGYLSEAAGWTASLPGKHLALMPLSSLTRAKP